MRANDRLKAQVPLVLLAALFAATAQAANVSTVAGNGTGAFAGDGGAATSASLYLPSAVGIDGSGNLYIADANNCRIRKVSGTTITTVAGTGTSGSCTTSSLGTGGASGTATAISLNGPAGVVSSGGTDLYIAETLGNKILQLHGSTLSQIAGNGTAGFAGDGTTATSAGVELNAPRGLAMSNSSLYIADSLNNRIRRISVGDGIGNITTIAGTGAASSTGDGGRATSATLNQPYAVAVDFAGNIYVAEYGGCRIRMFTNGGNISTVAGTGTCSSTGDGGAATSATLNNPSGIDITSNGTIYVAEAGGARIRAFTVGGTISTYVGTGVAGFSGDGGPSTSAQINGPLGLSVDNSDSLYFTDANNQRVRYIASTPATLVGQYHLEEWSWNGTAGELTDTAGYAGGPYNGAAIGSPFPAPATPYPALSGTPGTCGYAKLSSGGTGAFSVSGLPVSTSAGAINSFAFWMFWDGTAGAIPLGWSGYSLHFDSFGNFGVSTASTDTFGISSSQLSNGWHHIAVVLTNGAEGSTLLYVDGNEQTVSQRHGSASNAAAYVATSLYYGGQVGNAGNRFSGLLDELRVFTGALTPAQVSTLANETHPCGDIPIANYHMDELAWNGTSGEVRDWGPNGFNGTSTGGSATTTSPGEICGAGSFNGTSSEVQVSNGAYNLGNYLVLPSGATFSVWARPSAIKTAKVFQFGDTTGYGIGLDSSKGWQAMFYINDVLKTVSVGSLPNLNQWYHLVGTYDGTTVRLYVNGALSASLAASGTLTGNSSAPLAIGSAVGSKYFSGLIDEAMVFAGALTASQVASVYSNQSAGLNWDGTPRYCPIAATLVAQYRVEDGTWNGTSGELKDTAGYAGGPYNGTAVGSPFPSLLTATPARSGSPGTCGYASLAGPSSGGGAFTISGLPLSTTTGDQTSISFWVNQSGGNNADLVGWPGYYLASGNGDSTGPGVSTGNSDSYGLNSGALNGNWHHLVVIFTNGSTAATQFYLDGAVVSASQQQGVPNDANAYVGANLTFGGRYGVTTSRFQGQLDELKIYTGTLSQAQVATLYNETHPCTGSGATPSTFTCVETGQSGGTGRLYTKVAGTAFSIDALALQADGSTTQTGYTGPAKIELVDGSCGAGTTAACSSCTAYQTLAASQAFTSGKASLSGIVVAGTYKNLRCRVTDTTSPSTVYGCSSDNFSVRPSAVTLATSANAAAPALGSPAIKAGSAFTLTASTSPASYAGTLALDTSKLSAQTSSQASTQQSGGIVGTLTPSSLVANAGGAGNATYSEVGYLYLNAGTFRDDSFTAVDQASGDCITYATDAVNYLSDVAVGGKYGCSVGNKTTVSLGRFVPDHFAVTAAAPVPACNAFTYLGEDFSTPFTLVAQNSANATTQNYAGAYARLALGTWANFAFTASGAPSGSTLASGATAPSGAWSAGSAAVSSSQNLSAPASPAAPASVFILARPADADGVTTAAATAVNSSAATLYQGRARMQNAIGPETSDLPIPFRVEYFQSAVAGWQLNSADTCTTAPVTITAGTLPASATCVRDSGKPGASGAGCTGSAPISNHKFLESGVSGTDSNGVAGFAGNFNLWLAGTGAGNLGTVNLSASVPSWLQFNWTGTVGNPSAVATFGLTKSGPVIYRTEHY